MNFETFDHLQKVNAQRSSEVFGHTTNPDDPNCPIQNWCFSGLGL